MRPQLLRAGRGLREFRLYYTITTSLRDFYATFMTCRVPSAILPSIEGNNTWSAQLVQARLSYEADQGRCRWKFTDMVSTDTEIRRIIMHKLAKDITEFIPCLRSGFGSGEDKDERSRTGASLDRVQGHNPDLVRTTCRGEP